MITIILNVLFSEGLGGWAVRPNEKTYVTKEKKARVGREKMKNDRKEGNEVGVPQLNKKLH